MTVRNRRKQRELWIAYGFMLPAAILVAVLMYWPMIDTFRESLFSSSFINPNPQFVGFSTYQAIFADPLFWQILRNSVIWTLGVVILQNVFGFLVALLLNQNLPAQGILRSLILLPWVLPGVVVAILWRFMYDPQLGLINSFLLRVGIVDQPVAWLADPSIARWFDPAAFAIPSPRAYGNAGRNLLRGPGSANLDAAMSKSFQWGSNDRRRVRIRGEFFNALNHANFGLPVHSTDSPAIGTISPVIRSLFSST